MLKALAAEAERHTFRGLVQTTTRGKVFTAPHTATAATGNPSWFQTRTFSKGPAKHKNLWRKAQMGQYQCRFCSECRDSRTSLRMHIIKDHPDNEYYEGDFCNVCGNPWAKGENVVCTLIPDCCPKATNMQKSELRDRMIAQRAWRKETKYSNNIAAAAAADPDSDDEDSAFPPVPHWILDRTEGIKAAWMSESLRDDVYLGDETRAFLLNKIGLLDYFHMQQEGLLSEECSAHLDEIINKSGIQAALIKIPHHF